MPERMQAVYMSNIPCQRPSLPALFWLRLAAEAISGFNDFLRAHTPLRASRARDILDVRKRPVGIAYGVDQFPVAPEFGAEYASPFHTSLLYRCIVSASPWCAVSVDCGNCRFSAVHAVSSVIIERRMAPDRACVFCNPTLITCSYVHSRHKFENISRRRRSCLPERF